MHSGQIFSYLFVHGKYKLLIIHESGRHIHCKRKYSRIQFCLNGGLCFSFMFNFTVSAISKGNAQTFNKRKSIQRAAAGPHNQENGDKER